MISFKQFIIETPIEHITIKHPHLCTESEINGFAELLYKGGEVDSTGLVDRIKTAYLLAFLKIDDKLVGIRALKKPNDTYRNYVSKNSNIKLDIHSFPFELGWSFILEEFRGNAHSYKLGKHLIDAVSHEGVFSTTRTNNIAVHKVLIRLGFVRKGKEWKSKLGNNNLCLFVKDKTIKEN